MTEVVNYHNLCKIPSFTNLKKKVQISSSEPHVLGSVWNTNVRWLRFRELEEFVYCRNTFLSIFKKLLEIGIVRDSVFDPLGTPIWQIPIDTMPCAEVGPWCCIWRDWNGIHAPLCGSASAFDLSVPQPNPERLKQARPFLHALPVMLIKLFLEHRKLNWPPLKSEQLGLQISEMSP